MSEKLLRKKGENFFSSHFFPFIPGMELFSLIREKEKRKKKNLTHTIAIIFAYVQQA